MTHKDQANTMAIATGYKGFTHCQMINPELAALIAKMALALEREHIQKQAKIALVKHNEAKDKLDQLQRLSELNSQHEMLLKTVTA